MNTDDLKEMSVVEFMELLLEDLSCELSEQIQKLQELSHSPHELGFIAGRIFELNTEIEKLKYYLS